VAVLPFSGNDRALAGFENRPEIIYLSALPKALSWMKARAATDLRMCEPAH
jgi:hypothetical protein